MNVTPRRFSTMSLSLYSGFIIIYVLWVVFGIGFRQDHISFVFVFSFFYFMKEWSNKMTWGLIFFVIFWILYDTMRVIPNYEVNPVHIKELYDFEKSLFGIQIEGMLLTPNEYFASYNHRILDFLAGFFYLLWIPAPIAYAVYLFFKDKRLLVEFSACFLLANLFGFVIYYLYPAAPPWYVEYHGFTENFSIPGNPANLAKFDQMTGLNIFHGMYAKNANVFAAVPSLHAAYPLILFFYGVKKRLKFASIIFFIITVGIWFAAVYSLHHYIVDVILGIFCAIFAFLIFDKILLKTSLSNHFDRFVAYIQ